MSRECSRRCRRYRSCAPVRGQTSPTCSTPSAVGCREGQGEPKTATGTKPPSPPTPCKQRCCLETVLDLGQILKGQEDSWEMTREATRTAFLCGPGQLHRIIHGLIHQPNLNWAEGGRREDVVGQSTSPIIWHPEGAGGLELLCTRCSFWPSQVHTGRYTRPPSTLQQNQMSISN